MPEPQRAAAALGQPWRPEQQSTYSTALAATAAVVLVGWLGASGQATLQEQYPWFSLAAVGVTLSGLVHARWLMTGLVELRRREREVLSPLVPRMPEPPAGAVTPGSLLDAPRVVVVGAVVRQHAPDCPMTAGRPLEPYAPAVHGPRAACGLCLPC